jgi:ABC-type branched-subunit amino acid transport system substrate-binding protein
MTIDRLRSIFTIISRLRLAALGSLLILLSGCNLGMFRSSTPHPLRLLRIAAIFPASGVDAPIGRALQRGVDLAVLQHARLARGYRLVIVPVDEAGAPARIDAVLRKRHVLAIVGPLESQDALALLPSIESLGIATISPAMLPAVTPSLPPGQAGLPRRSLHPAGRPVALFRLDETENMAGRAAADLARAPAPGLAATVFVVDDGSPTADTLAGAFTTETRRNGTIIAGRRTLEAGIPNNMQKAVSTIIEAHPDLVFYAGGTAGGADLRRTLSLTGAPQLRLLTAGTIADHPGWGAAVRTRAAAAYTTALLPAQDISILPRAERFVSRYHRAFPGKALLPQSALAYDAATDEIAAMKALVREGKPVSRSSVRSLIASREYRGITGWLGFDRDGNELRGMGFSLYTCDVYGRWHYQRTVG